MKGFRLLVAGAAVALVVAAGAPAHPNEFELRQRVFQALSPGQLGPAPATSPRASSKGVQTLGHADPGGFNGDVVAHKGFAYLGSWGTAIDEESYEEGTYCPAQGVRAYSLFDLRNPTQVSTFADGDSNPELAGSWTEKVIVRRVSTSAFTGDLAVVSFQDCRLGGFRGIGLYDVSDPADPVELSLMPIGIFGVHELWLQVRGDKAYVYTAAIFEEVFQFFEGIEDGSPDFRIIDVSDPRNPAQVGEWGAWKELGIDPFPALGSFNFNFVHSVIGNEQGTRAYLSYWDLGTVILDVTDVTRPRYLGRTAFAAHEEGNAHSAWLAKGENVLIQTDEDFDPGFFTPPGTEISWGYARLYDISNPAAPAALSTFKLPTTTQFPPAAAGDFTVHDPKVVGNTLYLSYYAEGVVVVDITRPAQPAMIGQWLPEPSADPFGLFFPGEEYAFVWGVYPERNYVLASDVNSGLWVFQVR
jgi:hypothetical protein